MGSCNDHDNDNENRVLNVCRRKLLLGAPSLYWVSSRKKTFQCSRHNVFHRRPEIVNGRQAQGINKTWIEPDNINSCFFLISRNEERLGIGLQGLIQFDPIQL